MATNANRKKLLAFVIYDKPSATGLNVRRFVDLVIISILPANKLDRGVSRSRLSMMR
jgi:hypothetical protein